MANLMDYLDWRGDLPLKCAPFNEVDNLIFANLSYLDFSGIVPEPGRGEGVPLFRAAEQFFDRLPAGKTVEMGVLIPAQIPEMLQKLSASPRFREMRLSGFINQVDAEKGEQFSALSIETGDGFLYLSFRGTDDTLAGWREDFELACVPEVPAQRRAVQYTVSMARQYPRRRLRLGGHSKGGNLAVYAAVFVPPAVQRRIQTVWSNDGPGFQEEFLELPQYRRMESRIFPIVPKSSVVGMLLEHAESYTVVDSDQLGLLQHDGFSWQVLGPHFCTLGQVTQEAQRNGQELRQWLRGMSMEQRAQFVDALFAVLSSSGAETLTEVREERFKAVAAMVRAMKDLDKETRDRLLQLLRLLFLGNIRLLFEGLQEETGRRSKRENG